VPWHYNDGGRGATAAFARAVTLKSGRGPCPCSRRDAPGSGRRAVTASHRAARIGDCPRIVPDAMALPAWCHHRRVKFYRADDPE
jgi:hypothetical protein